MLILSDEKYGLNDCGYVYSRWNVTGNTANHKHLFYEIMYTISGTMVHAVNGIRQYLEPNTLVFIRPNDQHSLGTIKSKRYQYYNIMISQEEMGTIFRFFGAQLKHSLLSTNVPPVITLSHEKGQVFLKNLDDLSANARPDDNFRYASRLMLSQILYMFFAYDSFEGKSALPQWFTDLLANMQQKENFVEGIPALLRLSNKNQAYLRSTFKRYMNTTPVEYVNSIRLNHAEYLLSTTDLSIMEIVFDCGFNNASHFNHLFKSSFHYPPSSYRKMIRADNIDREKQNMHGAQGDYPPTDASENE